MSVAIGVPLSQQPWETDMPGVLDWMLGVVNFIFGGLILCCITLKSIGLMLACSYLGTVLSLQNLLLKFIRMSQEKLVVQC